MGPTIFHVCTPVYFHSTHHEWIFTHPHIPNGAHNFIPQYMYSTCVSVITPTPIILMGPTFCHVCTPPHFHSTHPGCRSTLIPKIPTIGDSVRLTYLYTTWSTQLIMIWGLAGHSPPLAGCTRRAKDFPLLWLRGLRRKTHDRPNFSLALRARVKGLCPSLLPQVTPSGLRPAGRRPGRLRRQPPSRVAAAVASPRLCLRSRHDNALSYISIIENYSTAARISLPQKVTSTKNRGATNSPLPGITIPQKSAKQKPGSRLT